jgi:hypothetical protein
VRLSDRKSRLVFTTSATFRYRGKLREIVVEPEPHVVSLRLAGTRLRYTCSWTSVYELAGEIFARQERERRKSQRTQRRKR